MYLLSQTFQFNGRKLPASYVLVSPDGPNMERETAISRSTNKSSLTPDCQALHYYASTYQNVLTFDLMLVKETGLPLTRREREDLIGWLDVSDGYYSLVVEDYEGTDYHDGLEYFTQSTGFDEYGNDNEIYGLTFHFECASPYAYTPEITYFFQGNTPLEINNTSQETNVDIYPEMTLTCNAAETVSITNTHYPKEHVLLKVLQGQILEIDNQNGIITDNFHKFVYETDTNLNWLHLAPGLNSITVSGNVSGNIRCRYIRKAGI